jgi:hypothetical protein
MYAVPRHLGDDEDYEWIELYNYGSVPWDLSGWSLNGVPLTGAIQPHSFFIVARQDLSDPDGDGDYFSAYYNPQHGHQIDCPVFDAKGADLSLDNHAGRVELRDRSGKPVDAVDYTAHSGKGATLERGCPFAPSEHSKWDGCRADRALGTPDYQNTRLIVSSELHLTDADETTRQLGYSIRLRNNSLQRGSLDVWFLIAHIESGAQHRSATRSLFLEAQEEVVFTGIDTLPATLEPGEYRLTLIHGADDDHSLAPENEEFSLLSSD